jgi:hypothetical protein
MSEKSGLRVGSDLNSPLISNIKGQAAACYQGANFSSAVMILLRYCGFSLSFGGSFFGCSFFAGSFFAGGAAGLASGFEAGLFAAGLFGAGAGFATSGRFPGFEGSV